MTNKDLSAKHSNLSTGIRINSRLVIPQTELIVRATRSSGAGGQHVNKTASRVEVVWNIARSQVVSHDQRTRLLTKLATRLTSDGELRVVASDTRSQRQNRELAETRLVEIVRRALIIPKVRKPTKPSKAQKQARLNAKRQHSLKKRERRLRSDE
jgi:ribosome-associated protein